MNIIIQILIKGFERNSLGDLNPVDALIELLNVNSENKESIITIFQNYLINEVEKADNLRLKILFAIIDETEDLIDEITLQKINLYLKTLPSNEKFVAMLKYRSKLISEYELLEKFGLKILEDDSNHNFYLPINKPLILLLLQYLSDDKTALDIDENEKASNFLRAISKYFENRSFQEIEISFNQIGKNWVFDETNKDLFDEEIFGSFVLMAILVERNYHNKKWIRKSLKKNLVFGKKFGDIFLGRVVNVNNYKSQIKSQLSRLKLTQNQETIIWKWVSKEINFLRKT